MIMPLILNVVIVSTKHLLHVYHCQQSILVFIESSIQSPDSFEVQVVQVTIENLLVLGWSPKGTLLVLGQIQKAY